MASAHDVIQAAGWVSGDVLRQQLRQQLDRVGEYVRRANKALDEIEAPDLTVLCQAIVQTLAEAAVTAAQLDTLGSLLRGLERTPLYTQAELDQAVADGGYEDIGDHRVALGAGRCVVHGEQYTPTELNRLREREGGGSGG